MVATAPSFPEIYPRIAETLKNKRVIIYNARFDIKILAYCCRLHNLPVLQLSKRSDCLMEWAAQWGGDWSYYYEDYKYFPLPGGGHRSIGRLFGGARLP
jgi:DNA polymerase-3 subunit epsilon